MARISRFFLLGLSNFQRGCLDEGQAYRVGASVTFVSTFLLPVLAEFHRAQPKVRFTVEAVQELEIERRLHDLTLDFGIVTRGELSRPLRVAAVVAVDGTLDDLPEAYRTCLYRVVQEALTNCAKHAKAKNVLVTVHGRGNSVEAVIQDDGIGFDTASRSAGLGLVSIQERVQELEGTVRTFSQPAKGTTLRVEIPVKRGEATWAKSAS